MLWTEAAGPSCWHLLHLIAVTQNRQDWKWKFNVIQTILESIPCDSCRQEALTRWHNRTVGIELFLYKFHNDVNTKLNYSTFPITSLSKYRDSNEIKIILTRDLFITKFYSLPHGLAWFKDVFHNLLTKHQQENYLRYETMVEEMIQEEREKFNKNIHKRIFKYKHSL